MVVEEWKPGTRRTDAHRAQEARDSIAGAATKTAEIVRGYTQAAHAARTADYNPHGHLTPDGVVNARNKAAESVRAEFGQKLDEHRSDVQNAADTLARIAGSEPPPDADTMARRAAYWRRAQSLLAAGAVPGQVIRDARTDPEALLALRDELPTYTAAQAMKNGGPRATAAPVSGSNDMTGHGYLQAIDAHLAATDHPAATYATARAGLSGLDAANEHLDSAARAIAGTGSALHTAITSALNSAADRSMSAALATAAD